MLPVRIFNRHTDGWGPGPLSTWSRWPLEFGDLFDRALGSAGQGGFRVNVRRDGEDLILDAELPGLSQEDVEITVENQTLTIAGEYKQAKEEEKTEYEIRERRYGRISRSFSLPETADGEHVTAHLKDGVLTLRVPTREEAKPRRIEVQPG